MAQLTTASKVALSALVQGTTGQILLAAGGAAAWGSMANAYAMAGSVVQTAYTLTGAVATGTTAMVNDDTPPTITEGDEFMTRTFTPLSATNVLLIFALFNGANSGANPIIVSLCQDAITNSLNAVQDIAPAIAANVMSPIHLMHAMVSGTTSAITFRIRAGAISGTTTFNGLSGGRKFGGVCGSGILVMEIKV